MINVTVCGALGRMGKSVIGMVDRDPKTRLTGAVEGAGHAMLGKVIGGSVTITDDLKSVIRKTGVVIDFSTPESTVKNLSIAAKYKKPYVIGTTGFSEEDMKFIRKCAAAVPVALSANWSIGMNAIFNIAGSLASILYDYDVEIVEVHHNRKQDAPSGTAKRLAEEILKSRKESRLVYGRHGDSALRNQNEIGIHAVRLGGVIGDHTVTFGSDSERIEIVHRSQSRENFSAGAVMAAKWLAGRKPGLYDMKHVLGFK
jgi:4-hydroxy-tetrahydrodipicolinate reductase